MRGLVAALVACATLASIPAATAAVDGERMKRLAGRIAALGENRLAGSAREYQASAIVKQKFVAFGYTTYRQRFPLPNGDRSRNVIGRTNGTLRVVIVGHMDGVRNTRAANDNGSGTAGVVEVARELKDLPGVLVAALGAEEREVTGSSLHLGSLKLVRSLSAAERDTIRLVVSLDMIGVGTVLNVRGIEASPNRSARKLLAAAERLGFSASYLQDSGVSDHAEFTRAGVPATLLTWRWDPCWHEPCDATSRLVPKKLRRAARLTLSAARHVLN
jgi:Zn-dependent M28 family amino/carboxypeptidase